MVTKKTGRFLFGMLIPAIVLLSFMIFYQLGIFHQALSGIAILTVIIAAILIVRVLLRKRQDEEPPEDFLRYVLVSKPALATYHAGLEGQSFSEAHRIEAWEKSGGRCENVILGRRCSNMTFLKRPAIPKNMRGILKFVGEVLHIVFVSLRHWQFEFLFANAQHEIIAKNYGGPAESWNRKHFCHICNIRRGDAFTLEGLKIIWQRGETVCLSPRTKIYIDGVPVMAWDGNRLVEYVN